MARIPRYTGSGRAAQAAQSEIAGMLSPQQAAATEYAEGNATAAGLFAVSDAMNTVGEIRSREEYSSAVAEYQASMKALDTELESAGPEVDENGKITYTPGRIMRQEEERRRKIQGEIRESLSSARAKRRFDQYTQNQGKVRAAVYSAGEVTREREYLKARLGVDINDSLRRGDFEGATTRLEESVGTVVGTAEYHKIKNQIDTRRDQDAVLSVAINPESTDEDFDAMIDALEDGKHPDGTDMVLDFADRYQMKGLLARERDSRYDVNTEAVKGAQRSNFTSMYARALSGDLSVGEVLRAYRGNELSSGDRTTLLGMAEAPELGIVVDQPAELRRIEDVYDEITLGSRYEDVESALEAFTYALSDMEITRETKQSWMEQARKDIDIVYGHPELKDLQRAAFATITGREEGIGSVSIPGAGGKFDADLEVAFKMQRELRDRALQLGDRGIRDGKLQEWYDAKVGGYKIEMQKAVLAEVGVDLDLGDEGLTPEKLNEATGQMMQWYMNHPNPAMAEAEMEKALEKIRKSTGLSIQPPRARPRSTEQ